jgi:hypothetical protein
LDTSDSYFGTHFIPKDSNEEWRKLVEPQGGIGLKMPGLQWLMVLMLDRELAVMDKLMDFASG